MYKIAKWTVPPFSSGFVFLAHNSGKLITEYFGYIYATLVKQLIK
jgi:hypothetical protein